MTRTASAASFAAALAFAVAGAAAAQAQQSGQAPQWLQDAHAKAQAQLEDKQGKDAGTVTLGQFQDAVVIRGELRGLPPGWHAIHFHETGKCEPDFEAAGDHFNPTNGRHGLDQANHHAGDLPNIHADEDGTARFEMITTQFTIGAPSTASATPHHAPQGSGATASATTQSGEAPITLATGAAAPLLDGDGAAVVVHAKPDDYRSQPSGEAGDRIACGVINRS